MGGGGDELNMNGREERKGLEVGGMGEGVKRRWGWKGVFLHQNKMSELKGNWDQSYNNFSLNLCFVHFQAL